MVSASAASPPVAAVCKLILIGASCSGKTSLFQRYTCDSFSDTQQATIGVGFTVKSLTLDNHRQVKLQLWDTAGQERFNSITQNYFREAQGCIAVFDLTQRHTLEVLDDAIKQYRLSAKPEFKHNVIIVGNKADLARETSEREGLEFARLQDAIAYVETSAKDGYANLQSCFHLPLVNACNITEAAAEAA